MRADTSTRRSVPSCPSVGGARKRVQLRPSGSRPPAAAAPRSPPTPSRGPAGAGGRPEHERLVLVQAHLGVLSRRERREQRAAPADAPAVGVRTVLGRGGTFAPRRSSRWACGRLWSIAVRRVDALRNLVLSSAQNARYAHRCSACGGCPAAEPQLLLARVRQHRLLQLFRTGDQKDYRPADRLVHVATISGIATASG